MFVVFSFSASFLFAVSQTFNRRVLTIVFRTPFASKGIILTYLVTFWLFPSTDTTSTSNDNCTKQHQYSK